MYAKKQIALLMLILPLICHAHTLNNPMVRDTTIIGTPEAPTLEGGVINTPESPKADEKNRNAPFSDLPNTKIPPGFHDEFSNANNDEFSNTDQFDPLLADTTKNPKFRFVLQRAKQRQLPASVALIPLVESHYQTHALSPKGAQGAWQLMPKTAKDYGLLHEDTQNFTASTEAALQLLTDLHQAFGNWTLTFAAYNAGAKRVKTALQRCPHAKYLTDLDLPLETQQYVYRLNCLYHAMKTTYATGNKIIR